MLQADRAVMRAADPNPGPQESRMAKAKTQRSTTHTHRTTNTEEVCVRARWASADCTGAHGSGAIVHVTASAEVDGRDFVIYGGVIEMTREKTMATAFTMLEAVAMMRGLNDAERDKLRDIA